jgi:hypothetical protein
MACQYMNGVRYMTRKVYEWTPDGGAKHY